MTKSLLALAVAIFITGCGQSGSDSNSGGSPEKEPSVSEAIAQMEAEGSAPVLDRSSTLKGNDADDDGVRDDIESYIESTSLSDEQKKGIRSYAKGMQTIQTVSKMTPEVANSITDSYIPKYFCMTAYSPDQEGVRRIAEEVSAFTANTLERAQRFIEYNEAMDGSAINLPSPARCREMDR